MKKILCVGEALIDMICIDKGKALSEGENFLRKPGGAPTNVAAAIAALGGQVELVTKIGTDPFGKYLIEVMQSFGVSTQWMFQDPAYFTTFAFVSLMENGERDFYFNRGADGQLTRMEIDQKILMNVTKSEVLQDHWNNDHHIDNAHVHAISLLWDIAYHHQVRNAHHAGPTDAKSCNCRKE